MNDCSAGDVDDPGSAVDDSADDADAKTRPSSQTGSSGCSVDNDPVT